MSERPPALRELMSALADVLRREQVRWYLFGAQAAILWGEPRMSADVDVTVDLGDRSYRDLVKAMLARGFDLRVRAIDAFVRDTRILPFLHHESGIPLDMVLAGSGLEMLFFERLEHVEVSGERVPVISPEDLIVTKILAGRAKDLEDVRGVLTRRIAALDLDQIRDMLIMLETALGQSDLLPRFEEERAALEA